MFDFKYSPKKASCLFHGLICGFHMLSVRTLLLQALEARQIVLCKEQEMAFARAKEAGFNNARLLDLIGFSEYFRVPRLRY